MNLRELFNDKYTILFILIIVLLVSIWVSRTYRNGGFGGWLAPSEGYGTGVIEGLALANHIRYQGEVRTQTSHAPSTTTGSRSDGTLIINQCSYVKNSETTFRFLFTTTGELRGASGTTAAKVITIKVPTYYIQNATATGLKATMRAYTGPLPATVGTATGTATDLDTAAESRGLAVTVPAAGASGAAPVADVGYCVITYTIQTANPIPAGKYALEISGLKWVNNEITPGTSAGPASADVTNVSLTSNAEPSSGPQTLVLVNLWPSDATKQLRIFNDTTYSGLASFLPCRKITTESPQLSPNYTGTATAFSMTLMLTNALSSGDIFLVQVPYVTRTANVDLGISFVWTNPSTSLQDTLSTISSAGVITSDVNTYGGGQNVVAFTLGGSVPNNVPVKLTIAGLQTPAAKTSTTSAKIRTYKSGATLNNAFTVDGGVLDQGEYILPAIEARAATTVSTGTPTSSGTASDGTTYVTSAAANVLISDVKRQMNWAIEAQKDYESAYKALRSATTETAKTDAQLKYDVAVARRNRLIASHPDSWYDGANWRYGDDGHVRKCTEPSTLSSNEGNCQNIFRMDASGNLIKSAEGNNILLMRKCPWKCNNPGQTGSDACRIDADCLKVTRWATYLPDGTQIEKNLLATTRTQYDNIARDTSYSSLDEEDIYRRGITRNFRGYGPQKTRTPNADSPGLFGSIRDATGNIIRGIGNWIDPNDPASSKRTAKHNAYYYEDGSPAATAYLGMYNGQGYEEESPFYAASRPMTYYYTTNYYYTDGQVSGSGGGDINDGKSNMPGSLSKVMPYEQHINL